MLRHLDYSTVLANIGATQEEIDELRREQEEDDAADREEPLPADRAITGFELRPAGDLDRKCDECGAIVPALPLCEQCWTSDPNFPF